MFVQRSGGILLRATLDLPVCRLTPPTAQERTISPSIYLLPTNAANGTEKDNLTLDLPVAD
jgi:hypothetical protein